MTDYTDNANARHSMKFQIKNRELGSIHFECELPPDVAEMSYSAQLGYAVQEAVKEQADLRYADLRHADLRHANLAGASLSCVDLRHANLSHADLRHASLIGADLRHADMRHTILISADLRRADLGRAIMVGANLRHAVLSDSDWIPKIENIHQAVYAAASAEGALDMDAWHKDGYCGTTHCRAGWVVVLAGEGGRVLEGVYGTSTAAALIYQASDPYLECVPDFYTSNKSALAGMKHLADAEAAKASQTPEEMTLD